MNQVVSKENKPGRLEEAKAKLKKINWRDYDLYLMLIPMILLVFLFSYKPLTGLIIAFKDYSPFKGIWASEWVGFQYFKEFFASQFFGRTIKNTLIISLSMLVCSFPAPIILALLLNELRNQKFKKLVQTISYIPHFISVVIVCSIVTSFLSPTTGVINAVLNMLGMDSVYFLAKPELFVPIYVCVNIWKSAGYGSIVYLASLTSIPEDLYEAARVDGAGKWQQLCHVTLPGLLPTIMTMLLVQLGRILDVGYEMIILLYSPGVYSTADVISTYAYRTGVLEGRYDYSTAIGLLNSGVSFILVVAANVISRKMTETSLW